MKTAIEILQLIYRKKLEYVLDDESIIEAMELYAEQFKPTAEANAKQVLGDVLGDVSADDLKCCGNCRYIFNPTTMRPCQLEKPESCKACNHWKTDRYTKEQRCSGHIT